MSKHLVAFILMAVLVLSVAAAVTAGPVHLEKRGLLRMTAGNDSNPPRGPTPLSPPPAGNIYLVGDNIDYGAEWRAPMCYGSGRHLAEVEGDDFPMVVWETGASYNQNVVFSFWDGATWLTPAEAISLNVPGGDAGRIAIVSDALGRVHAAWHGNPDNSGGTYEVYYARCDPPDYFWTSPVMVSSPDTMEAVFPSICVDTDDNPWVFWQVDSAPAGVSHSLDINCSHSTDGGDTWDEGLIQNITNKPSTGGLAYGWMSVQAWGGTGGDVHVAYSDTAGANSYSTIKYLHYNGGGATWDAPEVVCEGGALGDHPYLFPSIIVDSGNNPHIVFQMNIGEGSGDAGAYGYDLCGPAGWLLYTHKSSGVWTDPQWVHEDYVNNPATLALAGLAGWPNLGIDENDHLYLSYTMADSANETGDTLWLPFDAYLSYFDGAWNERLQVSDIDSASVEAGVNCMYAFVTPLVASGTHPTKSPGPGIAWNQLVRGLAPSQVLYRHVWPLVGVTEGEGGNPGPTRPVSVSLGQNRPNPFGASTQVRYALSEPARISLVVYNLAGQRIRVLAEGVRQAGTHRATWNGRDSQGRRVGSGIYLCRLESGGTAVVSRMTVVR
jgi:hypothetical protein